ncbi:MAG: MerR family transcriptional regulator [Gammaproteobacteria bacterium]
MTPEHPSEAPGETGYFPIRTVSQLTGVNPVTLRAWERRYGLVKPHRTAKGHRLYSRADIDRINAILARLDQGVAIGQMRAALDRHTAATPDDVWEAYQQRLVTAIARFDEAAVEAVYNGVLSLYPIDLVTHRLIQPLLRELGRRWEHGEGSVAEEHFFATYLRNKLGARFHHRAQSARGPLLLAACMPGERHELGLLMFALAAAEHGYRLLLLGADLPLQEMPAAVRRAGADAVVLAAHVMPPPGLLQESLAVLVRDLAIPVGVGGAASATASDLIRRAGAAVLGEDVDLALRHLDRLTGFAA